MDSIPRTPKRTWKRNRILWIVVVVAVAVFAILLFFIQHARPSLETFPWFRQLFPSNSGAVLDQGNRLLESGQYTQAIIVFNSAIAGGSDLARAYAGRGDGYFDLRRFDEALDDYTTSLKYARSADVLAARCSVYRVLAQFDLARSDCEAAVNLDPQNADSHVAFGLLYLELGDYTRAREEVEMAIHTDPGSVNAYYALSQVELTQGNLSTAATDLSKCIELDPKNARLYWERGFIYFSQGQNDLAREDMQAVLNYGSPDVDGELMLRAGTILRQLGKSP